MATTADDSLKRLEEILEQYEQGLAINFEKPDVAKYLNASVDEIKRMTAEDCSCAAIVINRFSIFLQKNLNTETAKLHWAENLTRKHIAPRVAQYSAPNAEERRTLAIQGDEFTKKLDQIRGMAQMRVDILTNLSYQIKSLADKFEGVAQSKRAGR